MRRKKVEEERNMLVKEGGREGGRKEGREGRKKGGTSESELVKHVG